MWSGKLCRISTVAEVMEIHWFKGQKWKEQVILHKYTKFGSNVFKNINMAAEKPDFLSATVRSMQHAM